MPLVCSDVKRALTLITRTRLDQRANGGYVAAGSGRKNGRLAALILDVDLCAGGDQRADNGVVAHRGGGDERRPPRALAQRGRRERIDGLRLCQLDVGAVAQQRADNVNVPVCSRPVQRGTPGQIACVDVGGAGREQELRRLEAPAHRGEVERRAEPALAVDVLPR